MEFTWHTQTAPCSWSFREARYTLHDTTSWYCSWQCSSNMFDLVCMVGKCLKCQLFSHRHPPYPYRVCQHAVPSRAWPSSILQGDDMRQKRAVACCERRISTVMWGHSWKWQVSTNSWWLPSCLPQPGGGAHAVDSQAWCANTYNIFRSKCNVQSNVKGKTVGLGNISKPTSRPSNWRNLTHVNYFSYSFEVVILYFFVNLLFKYDLTRHFHMIFLISLLEMFNKYP